MHTANNLFLLVLLTIHKYFGDEGITYFAGVLHTLIVIGVIAWIRMKIRDRRSRNRGPTA